MPQPMIVMTIVVMGVAGSGKTTVGRQIAAALGAEFRDGDDFHSPANVQKMSGGIGLTDDDRWPWLERLRHEVIEARPERTTLVLACSCLKASHRRLLSEGRDDVTFVYLRASRELVRLRLAARHGHFAGEALVDSQFRELEEPVDAIALDAALPPAALVETVVRAVAGRR